MTDAGPVPASSAGDPVVRVLEEAADLAELQAREIKLWRFSAQLMLMAFGAWSAGEGALIAMGGPSRLTAPAFAIPARILPAFPWSWAAWIAAGGLLMLTGLALHRLLVVAAGVLVVASWHVFYVAIIYVTIAFPDPGVRKTSYSPLADHGLIGTLAVIAAFRCVRLWQQHRPAG